MRPIALLAPALIAGGIAAVVAALLTGGARAGIVVVFPVIFGGSGLFLVGILLLVAGFLTLPVSLGGRGVAPNGTGNLTSGGLVLIGPVPIFWGSAGHASRRARLLAALAGGVLLVVAVVLALVWFR
jgi:uncharacterized membrane protein